MTKFPVDSTYYPCCHAIGAHGPDCTAENPPSRHALVDVGPATPPPSWCLPGAEPDWENCHCPVGNGGGQLCVWSRSVGANCVLIGCEDKVVDGRVLRSEPRVFGIEVPRSGWTAAQARELARQLVAAADLIDQGPAL